MATHDNEFHNLVGRTHDSDTLPGLWEVMALNWVGELAIRFFAWAFHRQAIAFYRKPFGPTKGRHYKGIVYDDVREDD